MQKIFLEKQSTAADAVEQVLQSLETEVTLVIPRGAGIAGDADHFALVKREAQAAGKTVIVESVDDEALEAAKKSGLETVHPLFHVKSGRMLSDIIPASSIPAGTTPSRSKKKPARRATAKKSARTITLAVPAATETPVTETREVIAPAALEYPAPEVQPPRRPRRALVLLAALAVLVVGGSWTVGKVWGKATVTLEFKKREWSYEGPIKISKAETKVNTAAKTLPGELFVQTKNLTTLFAASGRAQVSEKAKGKIIIYNAYSSLSQPLVSATRFASPDGKLFRLVSSVTVPGASITDGKIQASSITADIVADQPGVAYNVGAIAKLVIPGFKGTPKYEGFYGAIVTPLSGGLVGEKAVPTDQDIASAKDRARALLTSGLQSSVFASAPAEFVFVEGASQFAVTKVSVVSSTDKDGKFAVFAEAELRAVGFREKDRNALFADLALADPSNHLILKDVSVAYKNPVPDFANGTLTIAVAAKGVVTGAWNRDDFKKSIMGKSIDEAKRTILAVPELSRGAISLWPFYASAVPRAVSRIAIDSNY